MRPKIQANTLFFSFQDVNDDTSIKIADFGFAKRVRKPNSLTTLCGTASYIAPEVLDLTSSGYDQRADIWSCGVIMYVLLGGYAPFQGPTEELANRIQLGEYEFHNEYWMYTSPSAKNLISSCLQVDPNVRISAEEVLASDWMNADEETLTGNDLTVAQKQIRQSLPIDKFKGAVYTVSLSFVGVRESVVLYFGPSCITHRTVHSYIQP